jgi:hypothetical protein
LPVKAALQAVIRMRMQGVHNYLLATISCYSRLAVLIGLYLLLANVFCLPGAYAQGDNVFGVVQSAGVREFYGINDLTVLKSQTAAAGDYSYVTRHRRRGEETGIGGSFIGTASPTVESTPALIPHSIAPVAHDVIPLPNAVPSIWGNVDKTPALYDSSNKQLFDIGSERAMQKSPTSPALTNSSERSWTATQSPLIKKPATVIEPIEHLNLHHTGGNLSFPY